VFDETVVNDDLDQAAQALETFIYGTEQARINGASKEGGDVEMAEDAAATNGSAIADVAAGGAGEQ
jgi:hypothetical protein